MNSTLETSTMDMDDFLVPNLEDIAENPLIKDSFIGVTDPVPKWPLGVAFVEADGSVSSDVSDYPSHSNQQQFQFDQLNRSPQGRQRQDSFNIGHLLAPNATDFSEQKQGLCFPQQPIERIPIHVGSFDDSWLEDKTDLTQIGGWIAESSMLEPFPEEVPPTRRIAVDEDVVEKNQILQEIVRECEEIERRSSPEESSPSSSVSYSTSTSPSLSLQSSASFLRTASQGERETITQTSTFTMVKRQSLSLASMERKSGKVRSKVVQKEKKKAQNREAATRYREKKRRERDGSREEMLVLEARNRELTTMAEDFEYEIMYLKNLMREIGLNK